MFRLSPRGRLKVVAVVFVRLLNTPATLRNQGGWLFEGQRLFDQNPMTTSETLQTWDILTEIGFVPDPKVCSDICPGLSFDFGNLILSAGAVTTGWRLTPVILFTGIMQGHNFITEVQFEMPRTIDSPEMCSAWITWNLDQSSTGNFQPVKNVEWLATGRSNVLLLPWVIDTVAYEKRPFCSVEREWARMMIKRLQSCLTEAADDDPISFEFDGKLLKISCGDCLIPGSATGTPWEHRYILKACQLRNLPKRFDRPSVSFSFWNERFRIANWSYEGVVEERVR